MSRRYRALSLLLILSISACSDGSGPRDNQRGLVATAISAGGAATCAITPTHSLVCWGWINGSGEPPVTPSVLGQDLVRAVSMSRGWEHFCLVTLELKARCWGEMLLNATYSPSYLGPTSPSLRNWISSPSLRERAMPVLPGSMPRPCAGAHITAVSVEPASPA